MLNTVEAQRPTVAFPNALCPPSRTLKVIHGHLNHFRLKWPPHSCERKEFVTTTDAIRGTLVFLSANALAMIHPATRFLG